MNTTENTGTPAETTDAPVADVTAITDAKGTGSKRSAARKSTTAAKTPKSTAAKTPKPKAAPKPKPVRAPKPEVPAGWEAWLAHRTYMIRRTGEVAEGESKLGVMCRAHGTIYPKPVASITEGDKIGAKPNRPSWCRKCKAEQAAKA
jgi:hypothetical protein